MSKLYLGQIDPDKIDKSKIREYEDKNGNKRRSIDVSIWINDDADEKWKQCGIQQSTKKDETPIYLGNAKKWETQGVAQGSKDNLPF